MSNCNTDMNISLFTCLEKTLVSAFKLNTSTKHQFYYFKFQNPLSISREYSSCSWDSRNHAVFLVEVCQICGQAGGILYVMDWWITKSHHMGTGIHKLWTGCLVQQLAACDLLLTIACRWQCIVWRCY